MSTDLLARLIAAGTPADLVAEVAMLAAQADTDRAAIQSRRAADRDRSARRHARSRDDTLDHVTARDVTGPSPSPAPSPFLPPNPQPTPAPTHTPGCVSAPTRKADPFPCPEGVDPVDWQGLKDNRRRKRAALSAGAHRQIIQKLERWQRDGWPPGPIVACAVERGWTTVFETDEMKGQQNGIDRYRSGRGDRQPDGFTAALRELASREAADPHA